MATPSFRVCQSAHGTNTGSIGETVALSKTEYTLAARCISAGVLVFVRARNGLARQPLTGTGIVIDATCVAQGCEEALCAEKKIRPCPDLVYKRPQSRQPKLEVRLIAPGLL